MESFTKIESIFQGKRPGLFCDFDGTLSRIVPVPDNAKIIPENHRLLYQLKSTITTLAVISGRAAKDVAERVNINGLIYIGNHGMEKFHDNTLETLPEVIPFIQQINDAAKDLHSHLLPNMQLENKSITLSIHYRQTENPVEVREKFLPIVTQIAKQFQLKLFEGRMIFELRPPMAIDKGTAFHSLVNTYNLDGAVFIGDDITDTAAFIVAKELRIAGLCNAYALGVVDEGTPQSVVDLSDLTVFGVRGVTQFLSWFLEKAIASSI